MIIPQQEYAKRRNKVLSSLRGSAGVIFAGEENSLIESFWKPHAHFEYLTGIINEPGAMLLFDSTNPIKAKQIILFLPPLNPEKEKWDGLRDELGNQLREETGCQTILRTTYLHSVLLDIALRSPSFATLMPPTSINSPVAPDLSLWRKLSERIPNLQIKDSSSIIPKLRSIKSKNEIAIIQKAVDITAEGFSKALKFVSPNLNEYKVQATLEYGYSMAGGRGSAFPPIVGSGVNSTVLHYKDNNQKLNEGDLVCIDSGASYGGYGADITRTVPVSGKFSKRQKEIYELVLKAEEKAIKAVKPGAKFNDIDAVARNIIAKAGYGDYFIHGIGHHLGLETHDNCGPAAPLKAGAVITIEPGIYLPDEGFGVRIEDDILVTEKGRKNLSKAIPKTVLEIESVMQG